MSVPQRNLTDVNLESEDELADDIAEDDPEEKRLTLESTTISSSSSSSSSSCATIALLATEKDRQDISPSSKPLAPPLFRGQDDDNSEDEVGTLYAAPQPEATFTSSNPASMLLSPPQEETSLHTYGPSSFTPKRRIFVNAVSRKYGKIRGVEDDEGTNSTEDVKARARLATSPPTPTTPILSSAEVKLPTTPPNRSPDGRTSVASSGAPSHYDTSKSTPLAQIVAPRLPLNDSQAPETTASQQARTQSAASPEFEMTGQRRVGMGEDTAGPCASPSQKLCKATKGLHLVEAIEISSASDTATGSGSTSTSDSEDCVECDAEGNVLLRTPAVIADEIQRRALAGMPRIAEEQQRTPTKSRVRGKPSPVKAELKSPSSASKRRKMSPPSTPSGSKIKKRYDSSSDEGRFGGDNDDKSLVAGPSTPSKRRRRPHEGPKRVLPEWHQWEDLLIMHEASQGRLGSAGNILCKINEKREGQGLELREAQDIRNRWAKLKATMQNSVVALHRSF